MLNYEGTHLLQGVFMKGFITKAMILVCGLCISSGVFANKNMGHTWICGTNASSASNDADKKTDEMMAKKAMAGKDAFNFAYKHCRDCTKITCSVATDSGKNNN